MKGKGVKDGVVGWFPLLVFDVCDMEMAVRTPPFSHGAEAEGNEADCEMCHSSAESAPPSWVGVEVSGP